MSSQIWPSSWNSERSLDFIEYLPEQLVNIICCSSKTDVSQESWISTSLKESVIKSSDVNVEYSKNLLHIRFGIYKQFQRKLENFS